MSIKKSDGAAPTDINTSTGGPSTTIDLFSLGVLNALSAHIAVLDNNGSIIAINNAWKKFATENNGHPNAVNAGSNYFDACIHAVSNDNITEAKSAIDGIKRVLAQEIDEYELEYACHSPEKQRWFLMRVTPMAFMGTKAVVSHINITDKKISEEKLIDREKEMSAINYISRTVNSSSISLETITDTILEQISLTIRPDLTLLFLREKDKILLKGVNPDDQTGSFEGVYVHRVGECLCGLSVSTGESVISKNIHRDERCSWEECKKAGFVSFAAIPLKCRGSIIGTLGIASKKQRDFKRRQDFLEAIANDIAVYLDNCLLYEKTKAYAHDLEFRLSEKKRMEKQLQHAQKMEAIGTLAGGIAHDFNNILYPIIGYAEMLIDDLPVDHPFQENAESMLSSALRARDLVQQILAFSRQSETETRPIRAQQAMKEALKLIRASIPTTIKIEQDIEPNCGLVYADASKIHQLIMNLATNAYHAMEENGGKLTVTLKEIYVERERFVTPGILPGAYAYITVSDTGTGIDSNKIDKVFEPYFTTKEKDKGTGLGLSIVHGIVKELNGVIQICSEKNKGTDVHVHIPVISDRADKRPDQAGVISGGSERILLVDDEEAIVKLEKQMLERLGYHVTVRTGSVEAFEAFRANPNKFDLVITDMTMPNMTGIQLSQKIRKIKADIPIIICTGYSEQMSEEKCLAAGINDYVMKPVVTSELSTAIRNVIDTAE